MKVALAILVACLAVALPGCGGDEATTTETTAAPAAETAPRPDRAELAPPTLSDPDDPRFATVASSGSGPPDIDPPNRPTPSVLLVRDLRVGSGPAAELGDRVAVRYRSVDYRTGKLEFFNWTKGETLEFQLGTDGNPYGKGFERAIIGMRPGGRRELISPAPLALGTGPLDYVVQLVRIESPGAPAAEEKAVQPPPGGEQIDPSDPRLGTVSGEGRELTIVPSDRPPPKKLLFREIEVGSGPAARPGDRITVFYIGVDYDTGKTEIDTWPPKDEALTVNIRRDNLVGWEEGVLGMRAGGRREVLIPAALALGTGALDYVFDMVGVEPAAEPPPEGG